MDVIHEGWLTKSPPSKGLWRHLEKWRRRWFILRQSKEVPAQYFLDYYVDEKSHKPKGRINLDLCDQVDAGLRMQRRDNGDCTVFSIRTQTRIYHLQAKSVADMEKWVEVICRACSLRPTSEDNYFTKCPPSIPANVSNPYIPISECFTGPIDARLRMNGADRGGIIYNNINPADFRGRQNSTRECEAIFAAASDEPNLGASARFSDLRRAHTIANQPTQRRHSQSDSVPPNRVLAPARPPKPMHLVTEAAHKDPFVGPRVHEPTEDVRGISGADEGHIKLSSARRSPRENDPREGYYHFSAPAVNRELKPGRSRNHRIDEMRYANSLNDTQPLQYISLDLHTNPTSSVTHLKTRSADETSTIYNTVDFLKTEALNSTRLDTEECRRRLTGAKGNS